MPTTKHTYEVKHCCDKMLHAMADACVMDVLANEPMTTNPTEPTAWIMSDGGHGGMESIKFCPFCGTRIEIETTTVIVPDVVKPPLPDDL